MPFTVSHAAAVLPLHFLSKSRLPMSALMIGSMAPDFAYFLPMSISRITTHSLAGLFTFCLPLGLIVWLVFVKLLERPTIALLPDDWRTRIAPTGRLTLGVLAIAALAIVLGAATHLVWDSFTHRYTPVVNAFPAMREPVFGFGRVPYYSMLQHVSTIFGLCALALWGLNLRRRAPVDPAAVVAHSVSARTRIAAVTILFASSATFALAYYAAWLDSRFDVRIFFLAIGGMTGWAAAWCAVALWISLRQRARAA
jgi:Domain of unknown function (DUF4184)